MTAGTCPSNTPLPHDLFTWLPAVVHLIVHIHLAQFPTLSATIQPISEGSFT